MTDMGLEKVITCHCGGRRAWINGVKICPHCDRACEGAPGECDRCLKIGVNLPEKKSNNIFKRRKKK